MDADQPVGCLASHRVGDAGADVASLGDVAVVAETAHQLGPGPCGPAKVPADLDRLAREAVPGQGGQHEVEGILGAAAVRGRVGQRADRVDQLDHRARPAVRHDQRQRVLVRRPDVDEVDVHAVDLGHELRQARSAAPRPARSRTRSPSSGRAPAAVRAGPPADRSATSSLLGHRVPAMRRRRSTTFSSRFSTWNGRISVPEAGPGVVTAMCFPPRLRSTRLCRSWHSARVTVWWTTSPSQDSRAGAKKSMSSWLTRSASS